MNILNSLALGILTASLLQCASPPQQTKTTEPEWLNNMHRLSSAHLTLLPLASRAQTYSDPEKRERIRQALRQMGEATKDLIESNKSPSADPIIAFTANEFANDVRTANSTFEFGDYRWSRFAINRTTAHCISCHTRADRGIKDFDVPWKFNPAVLGPVQTVEAQLANRRYDSAVKSAITLAGDAQIAKTDSRNWILAIERALGLIVRVNKDPSQAEETVRLVMRNKGAPNYLRRNAANWLSDIQAWKKEALTRKSNPTLRDATRLVDRAQSNPNQGAVFIRYLRASGILHVLMENKKSAADAKTLLYAGIVAEALRDLNLGFLDQYYFESCIRTAPHTELAEECYSRFESALMAANPFSEVGAIENAAIRARLTELQHRAEVKDVDEDLRWDRSQWRDSLEKKGSSGERTKSQ